MNLETVPFVLQAKRAVRLAVPAGSRLRATHGTVWITVTGDRRDYVIQPGGELRLGRDSEVVLEALGGGPAAFHTA